MSDHSTSALLRQFTLSHTDDRITVRELVESFKDRGLAFLLLMFALLCTIPIPVPGIHLFLAMPLIYVTLQQMIGKRHLWMPEKVMQHTLPRKAFVDVTVKCLPWIEKIENISKPRLRFLCDGISYYFFGAICLYLTLVIAVPGPLTNFVPAVGISLIALGLIMRDGLAMIIGAVMGILWSIFLMVFYIGTLIFIFNKAMEYFA